MPILDTDIKLKLSTTAGSAGNSNTGAAGSSLGRYISTSEITSASLHALFLGISGAQNAASQVDYQCVFVHNSHASLTLTGAKVYISAEVTGGASIAIAVDATAKSAVGSSTAQAVTIAVSTDLPSGVGAFTTPTTTGAALALGDLAPGEVKAVWIRRTAANTAAKASDGATLSVFGDTL